jgi:colicin import membrane protein
MTTAIAEYSATDAALAELRTKLSKTYEVQTPQGLIEARKARAEVRGLRTDLEEKRKALKKPLLDQGKLIDAEAARIEGELLAIEEPIDAQIKTEEQRREALKQEAERKAQQRAANARMLCAELRGVLVNLVGEPSAEIARVRSNIAGCTYSVEAEEGETHQADVDAAKAEVLVQLDKMHDATVAQEKVRAQMEEDRRRLEQERAAQEAAAAAERERLAAEQRAADEKRKAEEERLAKERAAQEAADAERRRQIDAEQQAAREKIAAEKRAAEQRRKDADAKAAAERERQAAEARRQQEAEAMAAQIKRELEEKRIATERARLEADRRAADEKARKEREAKEAADRAAREAEEEKKREAERAAFLVMDGFSALRSFVERFGHVEPFKGVAADIADFLKNAEKVGVTKKGKVA